LLGVAWYQRRDLGCIRAVRISKWVRMADEIVEAFPAL
jgi:hypothetical protein